VWPSSAPPACPSCCQAPISRRPTRRLLQAIHTRRSSCRGWCPHCWWLIPWRPQLPHPLTTGSHRLALLLLCCRTPGPNHTG
jgi:hypothetical protein